jgi:hypothetical protein
MQLNRRDLYRIILEEYLMGEAHEAEDSEIEDLLKRIMGDNYRPPEERDPARYAKHDGETAPMKKSHTAPAETMPIPSDDAPESEYSGFQNRAGAEDEPEENLLAGQLGALVQGMDPEDVAALFQAVFEKLPGVELTRADADEAHSTEYGGEEYERRASQGQQVGFEEVLSLHDLQSLIGEVMREGEYHDFGGDDEIYTVTDAGVEPITLVQRIQNSYHDLQGTFEELEGPEAREIAARVISDLETLMDITEYPEDYRE